MAARADRFEYETDTSSLSDYDSEWTQVSGAEDDSDFPPLSTASERSASPTGTVDGSVNGDVWEGLVDELQRYPSDFSSDESPFVDQDRAATAGADHVLGHPRSLRSSVATYVDEDSRVNQALDCSVMSTLRASRSRSVASSLHNSLTESHSRLRLSFPDPLISPKEDTDMGADADVEPLSLTRASTPTSAIDETNDEFKLSTGASSFASIKASDLQGLESDVHEVDNPISQPATAYLDSPCALTLALYGSASSSKWLVAERVISLALRYTGSTFLHVEEGSVRSYVFETCSIALKLQTLEDSEHTLVRVLDRTSAAAHKITDDAIDGTPSLAIILLPSRLPTVIPRHTRYLPLINPPSLDFGSSDKSQSSSFSEQVLRDTAQYAWKCLSVPYDDVLVLDEKQPDAILDVTALQNMDEMVLKDKLSLIFRPARSNEARDRASEKHRTNKWYTFAFVAATVLAVTFGGSAVRGRTAIGPSITDIDQVVNQSATPLTTDVVSAAIIKSQTQEPIHATTPTIATSFNDSAVQTWAAITTEETPARISLTSNISVREKGEVAPIPSTSASPTGSESSSKLSTWQEKISSNVACYYPKELMKRPVTALRAAAKDPHALGALLIPQPAQRPRNTPKGDDASPSVHNDKGKARAIEVPARTSLALIDAASTALACLTGHRDMDELNAALDDLLQALGREVNMARSRAKSVQGNAKRSLSYRNERAKERARHLRRAGEQLLRRASESLKSKQEEASRIVERARKNAKKVREEAREVRRLARRAARLRKNEMACAKLKLEMEAKGGEGVVGDDEEGSEDDRSFASRISRGRRHAERHLRKLFASCEELDLDNMDATSGPEHPEASQVKEENKGRTFLGALADAVF